MRSPAVDAEAQREILQLAAVARQRANQRQGVVEHQAVHAIPAGREPAQHGDIEPLAVVRDEDVVAHEGSELGPHLGKRARIPHVAVSVAVDRARPGRDRPVRLHQRVKPVHDLTLHDPRRPDLHDATGGDVGVRRLQVERDVPLECGIELPGRQELERLEQGERESLLTAIDFSQNLAGVDRPRGHAPGL